jgi:hypothetical protein
MLAAEDYYANDYPEQEADSEDEYGLYDEVYDQDDFVLEGDVTDDELNRGFGER